MSEVQTAPLRTIALLGGTTCADALTHELHRQFDSVPPLRFSVADGSVRISPDTKTAFTLQHCPDGQFSALEADRGFLILGESPSSKPDDVLSDHLMVVYDKKGEPVSAFVFSLHTMMNNKPFTALPIREAIGAFGAHVPSWISDRDIQEYLRDVYTGGRFKPLDFPFAIGVAVHKLYRDDPNEQEAMDTFLKKTYGAGIYGLAHTQTHEDLQSLLRLGRDEKYADEVLKVLKGMETVHTNVEGLHMDTPLHQKLAAHMEAIFQEAFRGVLSEWETPGFSWVAAIQSFEAFEAIIANIYNVPLRKMLLNITIDEDQKPSLRLLMPILEALWLDQAKNYQSGAFQNMAKVFYTALGAHLDTIASETTGDTELERGRFTSIIGALAGRIGGAYTLVDAGFGGGERILRPVIGALTAQNKAPSGVIGVDLLSFPPPVDRLWTPVVADFSSDQFVSAIQRNDSDTSQRIVMSSWSAPADVEALDREAAFANFSRVAEWVVIDMPSPENYGPDQRKASGIGGGGTINRAFPAPDEQGLVEKPFDLPGITELVAQAKLAGFEWSNPIDSNFGGVATKYKTKNGYKRFTLVFRKVGEPQQSAAWMWYGSSSSGRKRPGEKHS